MKIGWNFGKFSAKKFVIGNFFYLSLLPLTWSFVLHISKFLTSANPFADIFFWSKLTRSRPQFFKRSGKMEIQGTPDQDMVSLVECGPWFYKTRSKVRETQGIPKKSKFCEKIWKFNTWKILKDWFNNFQKTIQKWKFSTILAIPTHLKALKEIIFIFMIYSRPSRTRWYTFQKNSSQKFFIKIIESPLT